MSNVLIIGDSCTDIFVYGDINRICPEAPVPVIQPTHQTDNGGMSKNVQKNIEVLGYNTHIITNDNDIKKVRYVDNSSNQLVLRVDEHDYCERINKKQLAEITKKQYDAIVISD